MYYRSDGPFSQFKNQYMFTNLWLHENDFGSPADWNFCAICHGKGENNALGGDVKHDVWRNVLQRKNTVSILDDFVEIAKAKIPHIKIMGYKTP